MSKAQAQDAFIHTYIAYVKNYLIFSCLLACLLPCFLSCFLAFLLLGCVKMWGIEIARDSVKEPLALKWQQ